MIKEKKKITKYSFEKTKKQVITEYIRTALISAVAAAIFTSFLAIHARNEMIKDLYNSAEQQSLLDKKLAQDLILQEDFAKDLQSKSYSVCLHAGELYEIAGDYPNAQKAYELAVSKSKSGNYKAYYKLASSLIAQEKFGYTKAMLSNIEDTNNKNLIKFKTRTYIVMGDKYYSISKFLSAAKCYEKAGFYYNKFSKKDSVIDDSIKTRIVNSYIQTADIMVKTGLNSDAVRFLKKAEKYDPDNFKIRYKLAIILSDSDPEKSVKYLDDLLDEIPQEIDYGIYGTALMKAANIADLDNRPTQAKYYRYRIHSIDMFVNRKVVYKNDFDVTLESIITKKVLFTYPIKALFKFVNISNNDVVNLYADFVLLHNDKPVETITKQVSSKNKPLYSFGDEGNFADIKFKRKIYTRRDFENYNIEVYLYKDEKYKTLVTKIKIPY